MYNNATYSLAASVLVIDSYILESITLNK